MYKVIGVGPYFSKRRPTMNKNNKMSDKEKESIEKEIYNTQAELAVVLDRFENVIDPDLVEYYTYSYKATEAKYTYLMKRLKSLYYN